MSYVFVLALFFKTNYHAMVVLFDGTRDIVVFPTLVACSFVMSLLSYCYFWV